ncbi:hypothetical protein LJK87_20480 [Paenibacillus sp. P25]|nr:hypothetical protein LJK87_20480 [Paenibacillus sp. P25]
MPSVFAEETAVPQETAAPTETAEAPEPPATAADHAAPAADNPKPEAKPVKSVDDYKDLSVLPEEMKDKFELFISGWRIRTRIGGYIRGESAHNERRIYQSGESDFFVAI